MYHKSISKWLMLLALMVTGVTGALAQSLTIADFAIKAGDSKEVAIKLTLPENQVIYGVQTDVKASSGLTIESCASAAEGATLYDNVLSDGGATRCALLSMGGSAISAGNVILLTIKASDTFQSGTIELTNTRLTTSTAGTEVTLDKFTANVTLDSGQSSTWRDIKADFTNGSFFTANDTEVTTAGLKMNDDGSFTRVSADDETANALITGKFHDNDHGIQNFSAVVKVEGPVKISFGTCAWGGNVTVKDATGAEVVPTFTTNTGACYHQNKTQNIVSAYYKGEAATLTIAGGSYVPYFAVEAVDPADIPNDAKVTFSIAGVDCEGVAPAEITAEIGSTITIPLNRTLYVDAETLTAWTDGTRQYKPGEELTVNADVTLTPIFTENADPGEITEPTTVVWDFQQKNGAPVLNYGSNKTGIYVTQGVINGISYDAKLSFDTGSSGKIANGGWQDWCQMNNGTKLTVEAQNGMTVSLESYNATTTTTIAGSTNYTTEGNVVTYTYEGGDETIDIVIGDGSYFRYVKVVYPVPEEPAEANYYVVGNMTEWKPKAEYKMTLNSKADTEEYMFTMDLTTESQFKVARSDDGETIDDEDWYPSGMNNNYGEHGEITSDGSYTIYFRPNGDGGDDWFYKVIYVAKEETPSSVEVAYSLGDVECEGTTLPVGGTYTAGDDYTIPAKNFTLYKEGYTLTAWSDGTNEYAAGSTIKLTENLTLTPVFTQNEVSLADRTEAVTVKFDFLRQNGAPTVQWQNEENLVWVAQATVNGKTVDVATRFSTKPGKFNNTNWNDWCQVNEGTTFAIPSCKDAVISMEAYDNITTTTIDGQNDYTQGKTISYTIAGSAETVDVVIGNGSYYRYIQTVLPVQSQGGGETFDNVEAQIIWPANNPDKYDDYTATPESAFSTIAVNTGDIELTGTGTGQAKYPDGTTVTFAKLKPSGSTTAVEWTVKPAAGLTFTPTKISAYIARFGTDVENGITISAKVGEEGEAITLGNFTAPRNNKSQADDKYGANANYTNQFVIELTAEQQAALASGEGLHIFGTVGVGNTKEGGYAEVTVDGLVNGTKADVEMFTLALAANPEEGGTVSAYPKADEYEAGSEVTLTATENFGYDFVNWTNAAGDVVSTEAKFKYTVNSNETLTANFKAVETYELALTVDGTNDYMVTVSPEPVVVDGKNMYEAGTTVVLTAKNYEGLVTFTNWSDGTTNSELTVTMDGDKQITAYYSEADIIAGWDFYKAGASGRKADFAAQDNDADALNLVNTETGETSSWLDKSTEAAGGYESFAGAAVNWRTGSGNGDVGHYHWQTKVNAEAFANINVQFQMLYNYNAYQRYKVEYSLDGEAWQTVGTITMEGAKLVASYNDALPEACNNQKDLYIRMIADRESNIDGTASANDGNTLAMFFITGSPKIIDDGQPPVLVSSVPENGATGASANGKIVLTFDERVKVAEGTVAYINNTAVNSNTQNPVTPTVSGKTVTFEYKGLDYATQYVFELAGNTVSDLTDNYIAESIALTFTTMERPTVTPALYDAEVSNVEELMAAISTANSRSDQNTRYRIFIKKGEYTIPLSSTMKTVNGYEVPECITFITGKNISFIGEDRDATVITNGIPADATFAGQYGTTSKYDGIGNSDVFQISSNASGLYWQDLTVSSGMEDARGRGLAIQDKGTKNIYKNVTLYGYQDTWTSNNDNGLYYFEGGVLRGRTDYICGKGDIYFNEVEFRQIYGGYCAVPSKPAKVGWVLKDCTINGEAGMVGSEMKSAESVDGNYTLGRPWGQGTPVAVWIDTKMNVVPSAIGWNEMSGGWPARFAEYNSMTSTGSQIDLSGRKTVFGDGHANNPILTAEEAAAYSDMSAMYGDWDVRSCTEQAPVPTNVQIAGNVLSWDDSDYALLWAVCKNGDIVAFTTENTFDVSTLEASGAPRRAASDDKYTVRAANEMGGLSDFSDEAVDAGSVAIENVNTEQPVSTAVYTLQGVRVDKPAKGVYIVGGRKVVVK